MYAVHVRGLTRGKWGNTGMHWNVHVYVGVRRCVNA